MPSFAKLDIVAGKMASSWRSPRPLGPRVRAVITLVPIPSAMTAICAAKMPKESRANCCLLIWGPVQCSPRFARLRSNARTAPAVRPKSTPARLPPRATWRLSAPVS